MNSYPEGTLVRAATYTGDPTTPTGGFRDQDGNLADPTTITLRYRPGALPITTITSPDARIVKDGTGLYHADLDTTGSPGPWRYEWSGTGAVQAAKVNDFTVDAAFP